MRFFTISILLFLSFSTYANYIERNHYLVDFLGAIKEVAKDGVTLSDFEYYENFNLKVNLKEGANEACSRPVSVTEAVEIFKSKIYKSVLFNSRNNLEIDKSDEALGLSGLKQYFSLNDRNYENKYIHCQFREEGDFGESEDHFFISYDNRTRVLFRLKIQ